MPNFIPSLDSLLRRALDTFKDEYETEPEVAAFAPGRVNLIGEHIDYNEGFVLPMALPLVTVVAGRVNGTKEVHLHTTIDDGDSPHKIKFTLNGEIQAGKLKWANYLKGVIAEFEEAPIPGFDAVIVSSVPVGGGVSSSAAVEVATYSFLEALTGKTTSSPIMKALLCQEAEHLFAGIPCGIMDQVASVLGRENHVLLLDCRSLEVTYIPFNDPDVVILITNSNVQHELSRSEYSTRKKQCEEIAKVLGKKSLRDANEEDLIVLEKKGVDDTLIARARHVITEIKRTQEAASALQKSDYVKFGKLMVQSHYSLRDDYEVSCKELDELVEAAIQVEGVYGSRMTGGGFGGCTVTLLKKSCVDKCIENVKQKYSGDPVFYVCKPSNGAGQLPIHH